MESIHSQCVDGRMLLQRCGLDHETKHSETLRLMAERWKIDSQLAEQSVLLSLQDSRAEIEENNAIIIAQLKQEIAEINSSFPLPSPSPSSQPSSSSGVWDFLS